MMKLDHPCAPDSAVTDPVAGTMTRHPLAVAMGLLVTLMTAGCSGLPLVDRVGDRLKAVPRFDIPANDPAFRKRLYTGAAIGNSHMNPDTSGTVFSVDNTDGVGTQLRLGYDVHNMLAVELDTSVLGTATLQQAGTDVKYSAASLSALIYGLNGVQLRSRREGFSAFGRLGVSALRKSSAVKPLEQSGVVPLIGIGAEYGFSNGVGVRGEITRFDSDAVFVGFGAIYRFGLSPAGIGQVIATAAQPALASRDRPFDAEGRLMRERRQNEAEPRGEPSLGAAMPVESGTTRMYGPWATTAGYVAPARSDDRDLDGVPDRRDRCPATTMQTVDENGCGLFDGTLDDVSFKSGSSWLTPRARGELDKLGNTLLAFPEARVRVRAHTDATGDDKINLALSTRRAQSVVAYLESKGVAPMQLEARGFGETRPRASNETLRGRKLNRRVELQTLPNLTPEALLAHSELGGNDALAASGVQQRRPAGKAANSKANEDAIAIAAAAAALATPAGDQPALGAALPARNGSLYSPSRGVPIAPLPRPGYVVGMTSVGVIDGLGFVTGSAELDSDAIDALKPVLKDLQRHDDARIAIMAHTDDQGEAASNLSLSRDRANSVRDELIQLGVDGDRLTAEGYGELLPLVQNVTEADRARNRRVEIRLVR